MPALTDLSIPISTLSFDAADAAKAPGAGLDITQLGVLLQTVVEQHAEGLVEGASLHAVSLTFDVSEAPSGSDVVAFNSRIDRKTRTLIFASGLASQAGRPRLKATIVYRIAAQPT
ncbi:MAG: hypothetical protein AAFR51_16095 [Pseudomonadota bacterium]